MIWRLMKDFKSGLHDTIYKKDQKKNYVEIDHLQSQNKFFLKHQMFDIAPMAKHQNPLPKHHSNIEDEKGASKCKWYKSNNI